MPLPEELREGISRGSKKTDTVKNKDGVYEFGWNRNHAIKGGRTPDPYDDRWILRRPPNPNLFLASLSESRGRDSF